jgi:hypothetical protein
MNATPAKDRDLIQEKLEQATAILSEPFISEQSIMCPTVAIVFAIGYPIDH